MQYLSCKGKYDSFHSLLLPSHHNKIIHLWSGILNLLLIQRPVLKDHLLARKLKLQLDGLVRVQGQLIRARVDNLVSKRVSTGKSADGDGDAECGGVTRLDSGKSVESNQPLVRVGGRAGVGSADKEHRRVWGLSLARVLNVGSEGKDWNLFAVCVSRVGTSNDFKNVELEALGLARQALLKGGVEDAVTKLVDRLASVPNVSLSGVLLSIRTEVHVVLGELVNVVGRVLSRDQSASGSTLARQDVKEGDTSRLAGISTPDKGVDVLVALERG